MATRTALDRFLDESDTPTKADPTAVKPVVESFLSTLGTIAEQLAIDTANLHAAELADTGDLPQLRSLFEEAYQSLAARQREYGEIVKRLRRLQDGRRKQAEIIVRIRAVLDGS